MASRSIQDRWYGFDRQSGEQIPTVRHGKGMRYRARYRDESGREHFKSFADRQKRAANEWLDAQVAALVRGEHVAPRTARMSVGQWCDVWLAGYGTRREGTVRQAGVHLRVIRKTFGPVPLAAVKPSDVKAWTTRLARDYEPSYVYAVYRRFAQVMGDAVHDGMLARSPCSRRTSPPAPKQRPYVATTEQVWGLYEAFPAQLRVAVLLGAFAGLRVGEAAALAVSDVDYMRGVITPAVQYRGKPLKSQCSGWAIPIPHELVLMLSANVAQYGGESVVTNELGRPSTPWAIERAMRAARVKVAGLPSGFRFQDLRHYLASMLISSGCDVKLVQSRLRHANATTTLNIYGHLWPDSDETTRRAVSGAFQRPNAAPLRPQEDDESRLRRSEDQAD